jgi:hypothetical protein
MSLNNFPCGRKSQSGFVVPERRNWFWKMTAPLRPLIKALKSGHIGGVALDVYEEEEGVLFEDLYGEVSKKRTRAPAHNSSVPDITYSVERNLKAGGFCRPFI